MMGKGEKDELAQSNKVLLRVPCWVEKTMFILPISATWVISRDKPLLLLEMQGFKDMKRRSKLWEK
jgi:hypothetical protein